MHRIKDVNLYGVSQSPMRPNKLGKKLLEESGFNDAYPRIKDKIFRMLDDSKTRTLYDVEENSYQILDQLNHRKEFDDIKHYAVNHPDNSLELIFLVASWVIRDDYASQRGIKK